MSTVSRETPTTVKPCAGCGRRPVKDQETGQLRPWRYASGRFCTLACCELFALFATVVLEPGGWGSSYSVASDLLVDCRLRVRRARGLA